MLLAPLVGLGRSHRPEVEEKEFLGQQQSALVKGSGFELSGYPFNHIQALTFSTASCSSHFPQLRGAVSSTQDDEGWSSLAEVGGHIANQASFEPRNYGYTNLSGVFEAIDLFEIQRKNKIIFVRNKPKN